MSEEKMSVDDLYSDEPSNTVTAPVADTPATSNTPADQPSAAKEAAAAASNITPASDAIPDTRPGLERYLAEYGIEGGMIQFEDGEKAHINDLTPEEQHVVLASLAKNTRPTIEQQNDLNEDEIGFLNMARESGKPIADVIAEIANQQVDRIRTFEESQNIDWDQMSEDAIYLSFLRDKNPDLSDEDLQQDLDKARETRTYGTVVAGIREDFKAAQERGHQLQATEINKQFDQEIELDRKLIVESISDIQDVAGFGINDDQKNILLGDMLELNDSGDSLLLEQIFSNPQSILEAAWFRKYGKDSINQLESYYKQEISKAYDRGKNETLGRLPESGVPNKIGGVATRQNTKPNDGFGIRPDAQSVDDLYND